MLWVERMVAGLFTWIDRFLGYGSLHPKKPRKAAIADWSGDNEDPPIGWPEPKP